MPVAYVRHRKESGEIKPDEEGSGVQYAWSPENLKSAYKLPAKGGTGETVAIVAAYNYPDAEADLNFYREHYKLNYNATTTACTRANGCFKKINQEGKSSENETDTIYPEANPTWAKEMSLDLDMVSAVCPECKLVLVEANNPESGLGSPLDIAENEAASLKPAAISNSWDKEGESSSETEEDTYFDHPGIPIVFPAGDYGYHTRYPATSQYVIAAGGTQLIQEKEPYKTERHWIEEVWHNEPREGESTGSGCSLYEPKPVWQTDKKTCAKRTDNDASAVAYNLSAYDSYERTGEERWAPRVGTSASAPIIAGIEALSTVGARKIGAEAFYLSNTKGSLFDITKGNNGTCTPPVEDEYLCTAGLGYDGPTGNGTPDGALNIVLLPVVTTGSAAGITENEETLHGIVNPEGAETKYYFEYGTTESLGSKTAEASVGAGTANLEVSKTITGLTGSTTYYYRIVATDSAGSSYGAKQTFTTSAKPTAETKSATVGETVATLKGSVNPKGEETKYYFEYGTTESYGSQTAEASVGSGTGSVEVGKEITGLLRNTAYHFRLVAKNVNGAADGADQKLTTLSSVITGSAAGIIATEAVMHGTVNPHGLATTDQFEYGLTASYGTTVPAPAESAGLGTTVIGKGYILNGLQPSTTYHFRLVEINSEGTTYGKDATFTTSALSAEFVSSFGSAGAGNGEFDEPAGIGVNPINDDVVVSDEKNDRVEVFGEKGEFLRAFGSEGSGNGRFAGPRGVAVDAKGNIWVTDTGNDRVEEFNEKGEYLSQFGAKGAGNGQFVEPKGLAVDSKGDVWVADSGNDRVEEFNEKREYVRQFGAGTNPIGVAADSKGNVWTDNEDETGAIEEHNEKGELVRKFGARGEGDGDVLEPKRIAIADGGVWIADGGDERIDVFNEKGEYVTQFGVYGTGSEEMDYPTGVAVDAHGSIWVADDENNRMDKWRISALRPTFSSSFGSAGAGNGEFDEPAGVGVNPINDDVVVSDEKNDRVEVFGEKGEFLRAFGSEGSGNGRFAGPRGVAVDAKGNIWVTDTGNDRVEEFNEKGEYLSQFGAKGAGNGQFVEPKGLAVDSKGDVWVADSGNDRVEEFNEKREYVRQFGAGTNPIGVAADSKGNVWTDNEDETGAIEEHNEKGELVRKFGARGEKREEVLRPTRLAIDSTGDVWVPEAGNNRIGVFNERGEFLRTFGGGGTGNGEMRDPAGVFVDRGGNIWIADSENNRVDEWVR